MNFGFAEYAWLLFLIPAALLLGVFRKHIYNSRLHAMLAPNLVPVLVESAESSSRRMRRHTFLITLISALLVVAILRPQWGFEWRESKRRGGDIVLAVDVSESMLATDISPNRLERAKRKITDLLSFLRGDRVALVAFSGIAFVETPLTLDYAAFKQFLPLVNPDLIPIKGSNIETALRKSLEALGVREGSAVDAAKGSAIILLTDGEELEGDLEAIGKLAAKSGVRIYVLGIGTNEGAPIPGANGYKKDKSGKVVITRLRPDILERIAVLTGGTYVQSVGSNKDIETIYKDSIKSSLVETEKTFGNAKRWNEYYQVPLSVALLILLFVFWGKFLRSSQILLFLLLISAFSRPAFAQDPEELGYRGKSEYEKGNFKKAEEVFSEASKKISDDPRLWLGLGSSQYRQGNFVDAQASFAEAMKLTKETKEKSAALFNLGNSFVQAKHYKEGIQAYEQSLQLNPGDKEASDNLAYAKRLLKEQEQQKKDDKDQQNKDQKNKDQQKDQQNKDQQNDDQNQEDEKKDQQKSSESDERQSNSSENSSTSSDQSSSEQQNSSGENSSTDDSSSEGQNSSGESEQSSDSASTGSSSSLSSSPNASGGSSSSEQQNSSENENAHSNEMSEGSSEGASDSGAEGEKEISDPRQAELETLLRSVEEKYDANTKFRVKKALEQLKAEKRKIPEKDW